MALVNEATENTQEVQPAGDDASTDTGESTDTKGDDSTEESEEDAE